MITRDRQEWQMRISHPKTQANRTRAMDIMAPKFPMGWTPVLHTAQEEWRGPQRLTLHPY